MQPLSTLTLKGTGLGNTALGHSGDPNNRWSKGPTGSETENIGSGDPHHSFPHKNISLCPCSLNPDIPNSLLEPPSPTMVSATTDVMASTTNGVSKPQTLPKLLWEHENPESPPMWTFLQLVNRKYGLNLKRYEELLQWSIDNIADFWGEVWDFVGIRASETYQKVSNVS